MSEKLFKYNNIDVIKRVSEIAERLVGKNSKGKIRWKLFADEIGFSYDTIRTWLMKGSIPSLDRAYEFCQKLGIDLDWLITGVESPESSDQELFSFVLRDFEKKDPPQYEQVQQFLNENDFVSSSFRFEWKKGTIQLMIAGTMMNLIMILIR